MTDTIDLNADLGESFGSWNMGDDKAMLDIVSSANVACGFHAGDPMVMTDTVKAARERGVFIGAHPGFDDIRGFGRRRMTGLPVADLRASIIYQIGALQAIAATEGMKLTHVKLHGALSNMACEDAEMARICLQAIQAAMPDIMIVVVATTQLHRVSEALGYPMAQELFADRAYADDGNLVSRSLPGAMIHDANEAADRMLRMIDEQALISISGKRIPVNPQTICVHGDSQGAVAMAEVLRNRLENNGIRIAGFI